MNGDDLSLSQSEVEEEQMPVKIRTYKFKRPQFLRRLTEQYFAKSKRSEKEEILRKQLAREALSFKPIKKESKSSCGSASSIGRQIPQMSRDCESTPNNESLNRYSQSG